MLFTVLLIACLALTSQFTMCGEGSPKKEEHVAHLEQKASHASDEGQITTLATLRALADRGARGRSASGSSNESSSPRNGFCFLNGLPGEKDEMV